MSDFLNFVKTADHLSSRSLDEIGRLQEARRREDLQRIQLEEQALQADRQFRLNEQNTRSLMESRQYGDELKAASYQLRNDQISRSSIAQGLQTQVDAVDEEITRLESLTLTQDIMGDPNLELTKQRVEALRQQKRNLVTQRYQVETSMPVTVLPDAPSPVPFAYGQTRQGELGFRGFPPITDSDVAITQMGVGLPNRNVTRSTNYGDIELKNYTGFKPMRVTAFGYEGDPNEPTSKGTHINFTGKRLNSNQEAYASMPYNALLELGVDMTGGQPNWTPEQKSLIENYVAAVHLPDGSVKTFPVKDIGPETEALDLSAAALKQIGRSVTGPNTISDDSPLNVQYVHRDTLDEWLNANQISAGLFPPTVELDDEPALRAEPLVEQEEVTVDVDFFGPGGVIYNPTVEETVPEVQTPAEPEKPELTKDQVKRLYNQISQVHSGKQYAQQNIANALNLLRSRVLEEQPDLWTEELTNIARRSVTIGSSKTDAANGVPDYVKALGGDTLFSQIFDDVLLEHNSLKEQQENIKSIRSEMDAIQSDIEKARANQAKALGGANPNPAAASVYQSTVERLTNDLNALNDQLNPPEPVVEPGADNRAHDLAKAAAINGLSDVELELGYEERLSNAISEQIGLPVDQIPALPLGDKVDWRERMSSRSPELDTWVSQTLRKSYNATHGAWNGLSEGQKETLEGVSESYAERLQMIDLYKRLFPVENEGYMPASNDAEIANLIETDPAIRYSLISMVKRGDENVIRTQGAQARLNAYQNNRIEAEAEAAELMGLPNDASN